MPQWQRRHLRRQSEGAPAAGIEETPVEQTKGVILKSASDPAVKEKADALLGEKTAGEKEPHPQAGRATPEKAPKEEPDDDPYAKAPHGDSSDDGETLEAKLRSLSEIPHPRQSSEARSDKAAYDEDERRSVPSSSPAKRDKQKKRAGKATDVQSATGGEPMKRKKKSKHGSKKAAKRSSRSRPSQVPKAEGYELDMEGVPRDKLERTLTAMHRVNQGLKASSDRAESAVSGMTRMMNRLTKARNDERGWLQEEDIGFCKTLWVGRNPLQGLRHLHLHPQRKRLIVLRRIGMRRKMRQTRQLGTPDLPERTQFWLSVQVVHQMKVSQLERELARCLHWSHAEPLRP